jgi:hypothetical protein
VDYIRICTKWTLKCIFGPFVSDIYPLVKMCAPVLRQELQNRSK